MSRLVLVSGGTSGLGLAIAEAYAADGDRVAVFSRDPAKVDAALTRLREVAPSGAPDPIGHAGDVRDATRVTEVVEAIAAEAGPIDVLVAAAAGNFVAPAAQITPGGFAAVVGIDLLGTFHVLRAAHAHLRSPGASVVAITAAQAWLPTAGQSHVGAAKAGIDQLVRTLAVEWGPAGIRLNLVAPGPVEGTEGMRRLAPTAASHEAWTRAVPLGRFAATGDIVRTVRWLCSAEAGYITGQTLSVDGGLSLGGASAIAAAIAAP